MGAWEEFEGVRIRGRLGLNEESAPLDAPYREPSGAVKAGYGRGEGRWPGY